MPAPHAVLNVGEPDRWPVAIAHVVRIALTMTNVTEPAIRRVIQPITQPVASSRDKGSGTKISYAKFRPAGGSRRDNSSRRSASIQLLTRCGSRGMSGSLKGRVALVTGSTGEGMGRSIALTLAREGADVVLNHGTNRRTSAANNRRLVKAVEALGARAIVVRANTAKADDVRKMFIRAEQNLGPVDILVNNAGGSWDPRQDITKVDDAAWQGILPPETDGTVHTIRAALPHMRRRRWGRVVNIGMERSEEVTEPPFDYTVGKIARPGLPRILF